MTLAKYALALSISLALAPQVLCAKTTKPDIEANKKLVKAFCTLLFTCTLKKTKVI